MKKALLFLITAVIIASCFSGCISKNPADPGTDNASDENKINETTCDEPKKDIDGTIFIPEKPVIYLYPQKETDVIVKLDFNGTLTDTYPTYNDGWNVTAYPNGTLINKNDGKEYSYLFWEGQRNVDYKISEGFVVKGSNVKDFLQEKLEYMGLTPKEYNEFIVYWLPRMQHNKYNLISFQTTDYTDNAKLEITPKPDSMLRVFMTFKAVDGPVSIKPQTLSKFTRRGFTVIEWGGADLTDVSK